MLQTVIICGYFTYFILVTNENKCISRRIEELKDITANQLVISADKA